MRSPNVLADYAYDDLDRLSAFQAYSTDGTTSSKDREAVYVYDGLDRPVRQSETHGASTSRTTLFTYLGTSRQVGQEEHRDGPTGPLLTTKRYLYDARGARIGMLALPASGANEQFTYGYDAHGSVSLLLAATGAAKASYGYRPYGSADPDLTKGDPSDRDPLNAYRYTGKRLDSGSGTLDMGARRFGPDTARFLQQDRYLGALADLGLSMDPLTGNRYGLAGGNPVSFVEVDGHAVESDDASGSCASPDFKYWCSDVPPTGSTTIDTPPPLGGPAPAGGLPRYEDPCAGVRQTCRYFITGYPGGDVEVVNRAAGLEGLVVGLIGRMQNRNLFNPTNTMVFGPNRIISTVDVQPNSPLLAHELEHIAQARQMGDAYLRNYIAEFQRVGGAHDLHAMENEADRLAGLEPNWQTNGVPASWRFPAKYWFVRYRPE